MIRTEPKRNVSVFVLWIYSRNFNAQSHLLNILPELTCQASSLSFWHNVSCDSNGNSNATNKSWDHCPVVDYVKSKHCN